MYFLLFLTVLVIMNSKGTARPLDSNSLEIDSDISSESGIRFKLPTTLKSGFTITINGTLNINDNRLTVLLPSAIKDEEFCKINWDFKDNSVTVAPYTSENYKMATLNVDLNGDIPFSLTLKTSTNRDHQIQVDIFAADENTLSSSPLICKADVTQINSIVIEKGVEDVSSLLFDFI